MTNLSNFILFQLTWFCSVLGAANNLQWLALCGLLIFIAFHFCTTKLRYADSVIMASAFILGGLFDTLWVYLGWVSFKHAAFSPLPPYWLICLWLAFALTINHSMSWMKSHYWLALLAGAISGPLSYLAGARLGAMQWIHVAPAAIALTVSWALFMPFFLWLSDFVIRKKQDS